MGQYDSYKDVAENTGVLPSPIIWAGMDARGERPGRTIGFFDDFGWSPNPGTITTATLVGPYRMIAESGGDVNFSAVAGGEMLLVGGTTGDADTVVTWGDGAPFVLTKDAAVGKLVFEARIKISSITDADQVQFFVGLCEETRAAAAGLFSGSGSGTANIAMADIDMIGFARFDDDGDALAFVYGKAGQTAYEVIASAETLVADTYTKVGFVYDPNVVPSERITVYVNGVAHGTKIPDAGATTDPSMAAATFPSGEEMTAAVGITPDSTTDNTLTVDWWGCRQIRA